MSIGVFINDLIKNLQAKTQKYSSSFVDSIRSSFIQNKSFEGYNLSNNVQMVAMMYAT